MTRFLKSWIEFMAIACLVIGIGLVISAALVFSYNMWGFLGAAVVGVLAITFCIAIEENS